MNAFATETDGAATGSDHDLDKEWKRIKQTIDLPVSTNKQTKKTNKPWSDPHESLLKL